MQEYDSEKKARHAESLTRGRLLVKNTFLNAIGLFVPLLAALYSVPIIIDGVGTERFGLLTLAWAVIGYFSLFDLGLSRAIIQMVAERLGSGREDEVPEVIWTALISMLSLGLLGAFACSLLMSYFVEEWLVCPDYLLEETLHSFYLVAMSIPLVVIRSGFRGVLIAYQRFDLTNKVRIPLGVYTFCIPLAVLRYSNTMVPIVCALLAGLVAACIVYCIMCLRVVPGLKKQVTIKRKLLLPLFKFGGWMTVTNIVGPVMVYMDRFFLGAVVSLTAVAYYATPHEIVTKIILIPSALTGVLFPAFSTSYFSDGKKIAGLFKSGMKYIFIIVFPIIVALFTLAPEGLTYWLGSEFSANSYRVFQILAAGVLLNCLAMVPFAFIQGIGKPDLTAKLHMVELPLYLVLLWLVIPLKGAVGAAAVWSGRVLFDTILLILLSRKFLKLDNRFFYSLLPISLAIIIVLSISLTLTGIADKFIFLLLFTVCFAAIIWKLGIRKDEKQMVFEKWSNIMKSRSR